MLVTTKIHACKINLLSEHICLNRSMFLVSAASLSAVCVTVPLKSCHFPPRTPARPSGLLAASFVRTGNHGLLFKRQELG